MAFQPATGVLYAVPQTGELDTVDTVTGAFTFVGDTDGVQLLSLEFLPDGSLLASGNGLLYSIDPATGAATFIGSTNAGTLIGLEGIPSADNIDLYSFTMASGQSTTLALKGSGAIVELLDSLGSPLAIGVSAANLDQVINNFTAAAGTYFARVTSTGISDYSLIATRDASIGTQLNDSIATAQDLEGTSHVLGALSVSPVLTGLNLWLGADTGVTTDATGNVSAWLDQSGSGHNAMQADSNSMPNLISNSINGQPALSFNGSSDWLAFESQLLTSQQFTIIAVVADRRADFDTQFREVLSNWDFSNEQARCSRDHELRTQCVRYSPTTSGVPPIQITRSKALETFQIRRIRSVSAQSVGQPTRPSIRTRT